MNVDRSVLGSVDLNIDLVYFRRKSVVNLISVWFRQGPKREVC